MHTSTHLYVICVKFGHLFAKEQLLMATVTHPAHTSTPPTALPEQDYIIIKERPGRELIDVVRPTPTQEAAVEQGADHNFCYDDLYRPSTSTPSHQLHAGGGHQAAGH